MHSLFNPQSVAVVGASDNPSKLGFHVMKSLVKGGFKGTIIPVNPKADRVFGIKACASISTSSIPVDLVIVVVPSKRVAAVFEECAAVHVKGIVLITAGFKEIDDPEGALLHGEISRIAEAAKIPVIGPNTFGMINMRADLNASFTPEFSRLKPGNIALVSQSGGISHLLGFLAMGQGVGFSKIVGLGNRLNVDFAQMVEYLMEDPDTKTMALYVEGTDAPNTPPGRRKTTCRQKSPWWPTRPAAEPWGMRPPGPHTGSMAGRHEIYTHAFKQAGILSVDSNQALLDAAKAFASCPIPVGPRCGGPVRPGGSLHGRLRCVRAAGAFNCPVFRKYPKPHQRASSTPGPQNQPGGHGARLVRLGRHQGYRSGGHGGRKGQRYPVPDDVRLRQCGGPGRHQPTAQSVGPEKTRCQLHPGPSRRLG